MAQARITLGMYGKNLSKRCQLRLRSDFWYWGSADPYEAIILECIANREHFLERVGSDRSGVHMGFHASLMEGRFPKP